MNNIVLNDEAISEIIDMIKFSLGEEKIIFTDDQLKDLILKDGYPLWVNLYMAGYRRILKDKNIDNLR